jgi:DNA helicase-2/ATP-dependent DNA helicase PcrA
MTRAERYLYVTHAMKRRVYGDELASEPSSFLNVMPTELLEDLSLGKSWLSFKGGSQQIDYEQGEYKKERKKYTGKTYDSVDSIADFFKQRNRQMGQTSGSLPNKPVGAPPSNEFTPGSYVRHSKYGRGLVLRREGAGESTKLTVSFPGYGQKKLVEKYAGLEKA